MPPASTDRLKRALAEITAMRAIAELLARLPDDEARARVLQWSAEHFPVSIPSKDDERHPAAGSGGGHADLSLVIDDDLFETPRRGVEPALDDEEVAADSNEDETIHCEDLAVDRFLVHEELEAEASPTPAVEKPAVEPAHARPAAGGLESLLRELAADLRRLALEWQIA